MKSFVLLMILCVSLTHCTKKAETPQAVLDLMKKYTETKEELGKFDALIKKAGSDEGKIILLNQEKELVKSRHERTKAQLEAASPEKLQEIEASAGGGGGHGGGH